MPASQSGTIIKIIRPIGDDGQWLEGESGGAFGVLPVTYVKMMNADAEARTIGRITKACQTGGLFINPDRGSKLELVPGDYVEVTGRSPTGFYTGECRGTTGEFPPTIVQLNLLLDIH